MSTSANLAWGILVSYTFPMSGNELILLAPVSGVIYPLERVPDPVFSQKLAGDGISIDPTDNILRAPCPGEILQRHAAGHAVTLKGSRRRRGAHACGH